MSFLPLTSNSSKRLYLFTLFWLLLVGVHPKRTAEGSERTLLNSHILGNTQQQRNPHHQQQKISYTLTDSMNMNSKNHPKDVKREDIVNTIWSAAILDYSQSGKILPYDNQNVPEAMGGKPDERGMLKRARDISNQNPNYQNGSQNFRLKPTAKDSVSPLNLDAQYASVGYNDKRQLSSLYNENFLNVPDSTGYEHDTDIYDHILHKRYPMRFYKRQKRQSARSVNQPSASKSCDGMCGNPNQYLPCSCSATCIVYGTCCEGFYTDCADTVQAAEKTYSDFLGAEVICTIYDVMVITSCRNANTTETVSGSQENSDLRSRVPIYDKYSKLVFINESIFQCNRYQESEGVLWGQLKFEFSSAARDALKNQSISFDLFSDLVMKGDATYDVVPWDEGKYGQGNCVHGVERTCPEDLIETPQQIEYKRQCESLWSFVTCNKFHYANFYCMKCSILFNELVQCSTVSNIAERSTGGQSAFSMLVSFSSDQMFVDTDSKSSSTDDALMWKSLSCGVGNGGSCSVVKCDDDFKLNENNTCSAKKSISLKAILEYKLSEDFMDQFGDFLNCMLNHLEDPPIATQNYNALTNIAEIDVNIAFYVTGENEDYMTSVHRKELIDAIESFFSYNDGINEEIAFADNPIQGCLCAAYQSCYVKCGTDNSFYMTDKHSKGNMSSQVGRCLTSSEITDNGATASYPLGQLLGVLNIFLILFFDC